MIGRAPGKLFVAGEYAVVEPGHPALLVAVDRYVTVTATPGSGPSEVRVRSDLRSGTAEFDYGPNGLTAHGDDAAADWAPIVSAVDVVTELLSEAGRRPGPVELAVDSTLHNAGTKFGLGSSGAVTVATIEALTALYELPVSPEIRYRLAMLATARLNPRASGGDLAASVWGGWIRYSAPDREQIRAMAARDGLTAALRADWPGFSIRPLPPPADAELLVGWTGAPASTAARVGRADASGWRGSSAHREFLRGSSALVDEAVAALERGAGDRLAETVRACRRLLADLDRATGIGIFTDRLRTLCETAEACGAAAKPSGAGGGDCGIAITDAGGDSAARVRDAWTAADITPLPLRVTEREGALR
ncbi:phosphomevalonate kinase [Nocardia transvalensis]|uniref:phosphomevalonate kinase n=1 Tax=Nocardia transvalensis TaxID=37333 RepID=UPI0018937042|nr:phosphomevalonate kinase [Nocardia transvalensis]MBF6329422.1 phosphomevalonate kinase [Nocardia transvalensis]